MVMGKLGIFSMMTRKGVTKDNSDKAGGGRKYQAAGQQIAPVPAAPASLVPDLAASDEQEELQDGSQTKNSLLDTMLMLTTVPSIAVTLRNASDHSRQDAVDGNHCLAQNEEKGGTTEPHHLHGNLHLPEVSDTSVQWKVTVSAIEANGANRTQNNEGGHIEKVENLQIASLQVDQLASPQESEKRVNSIAGSESLHEYGSQHSGECSPYGTSICNYSARYCVDVEHGVPEHLSDPGVYFNHEKEARDDLEMQRDGGKEGGVCEEKPCQTSRSECYQLSEGNNEGSQLMRQSGSDPVVSTNEDATADCHASDPGVSPRLEHCTGRSMRSAPNDGNNRWGLGQELQSNSSRSVPDRMVDVAQQESHDMTATKDLSVGTEVSPMTDTAIILTPKRSDENAEGFAPMSQLTEVLDPQHLLKQLNVIGSRSAPDLLGLPASSSVRLSGVEGKVTGALITVPLKENEVMKLAVTFDQPGQSSMSRVHEWVTRTTVEGLGPPEDFEQTKDSETISEPASPPAVINTRRSMSSGHLVGQAFAGMLASDSTGPEWALAGASVSAMDMDVEYANRCVRSMERTAVSAHLSSRGLTVLPIFASFHYLKSLHLAHNSIARIHAGSLPRSLHVLDLSHNRLFAIEGLRELTRLRVVNLSYNRISRIGHGLASCSSLRELYLAGNKISEVEGLHRLLKLTVLDLAHNKVTSTKALGQLAANYGSMQALNLIGNPIHINLGDDAFRRFVTGLLPHLVYLNQQPVKAVSARDAATDGVARAALGAHNLGRGTKSTARSSTRPASGTKKTATSGHRRSHSSGPLQPTRNMVEAASSSRSNSRLAERSDRHRRRPTGASGREEAQTRLPAKRAIARSAAIAIPNRNQLPEVALPVEAAELSSTTPDLRMGRNIMRSASTGSFHH